MLRPQRHVMRSRDNYDEKKCCKTAINSNVNYKTLELAKLTAGMKRWRAKSLFAVSESGAREKNTNLSSDNF
jgi:hypothetical protein